jgi:predicted ATPase
MISAFEIEGFKCFTGLEVRLAPITVLCGVNGAGKSSFIQALLLAHLASRGEGYVPLNGSLGLRLGQALDVLRLAKLGLAANSSLGRAAWTFSAQTDDALVLRVDESPGESAPSELSTGLIYLQAERLGPRDMQEVDSTPVEQLSLGSQGEYVAQVLNLRGGRYPVRDELCHPGRAGNEVPKSLEKQTEAWLQEVVPGIELRVVPLPSMSAAAVRFRRSGQATEWLRPQNIGFGLTYVLPVIVAGLVAQPGAMIIVENPEAHLHPQAQSVLARFLGRVAASGVQVVVETHSDHVLNGLRLAIASDEPLGADDLAVQFFSCTEEGVSVQRIQVTDRGGLTAAPPGFFDQSEKDLTAILKARRRA